MTILPFEAILFDLDGTLIDTEQADFTAGQMLAQEMGVKISLDFWAENVVGIMEGYDIFFAELQRQSKKNGTTKEFLWQRLQQLWEQTMQNMALMPGATPLLSGLRASGYRVGLASASDQAWVYRWLNHFDLHPYFHTITTGDDVRQNKPAPDIYYLAAEQLQVSPQKCLVFEDSVFGIQAAKSAGMTVVAVPNTITRNLDFNQADKIINGLNQISIETLHTISPAPSLPGISL